MASDKDKMIAEKAPLLPQSDNTADSKDGNETSTKYEVSDNENKCVTGDNGNNLVRVKRLITVEPVIGLFVLSQISFSQLYPQYIYGSLYEKYNVTTPSDDLTCQFNDAGSNTTDPTQAKIQGEMAVYQMAFAVCTILPSLILLPLVGPYSDRQGRKPFILIPLVGVLVMFVFLTLLIILHWPLELIYISIITSGLVGGGGIIISIGTAYISDITDHSQRTTRFIALEICISVGNLIGQLGTGYTIKYLGYEAVSLILGVMMVCLIVYSVLLPEPIQQKKSVPPCQCDNYKDMILIYVNTTSGKRYMLLVSLMIFGTIALAEYGAFAITTYFFLDPPFCWASDNIGLYNAVYFMAKIVATMLITRCLIGRIQDTLLLLAGTVSMAAYFLVMSFSSSTIMVYIAMIFGLASMTINPLLRSYCSKLVHKNQQATLFSGLMIVQLLFTMIGALVFSPIYASSARSFHGLAFLTAAVILLLASCLVTSLTCCFSTEHILVVDEKVEIEGKNEDLLVEAK